MKNNNKKINRKNLRNNITNFYIIICLFFILGFAFFTTSKLTIDEDIPINQTPLKEELDLRANGKLKINRWIYDENNEKMEVVLETNGMTDYKTKLQFSSVTRKNPSVELPTNVVYKDSTIFILEINNIKKGFEQVAIRLHKSDEKLFDETSVDEELETQTISTIYTDERVVERKEIETKDTNKIIAEITDEQIFDSYEIKEKEIKDIETIKNVIETIKEEINVLENELLYQTLDEQVETNNNIYRLEKDIEMYEKKIEEKEYNIKNIDTKIEKYEQRKRDVSI